MDNPICEHGNGANPFLAGIRIVKGILGWLASLLVTPTQDELMQAGVYLGEMRD